MEEIYNLNQLALMTGLSTRTLRNDLATGILEGEKEDGMWIPFTENNSDQKNIRSCCRSTKACSSPFPVLACSDKAQRHRK